jgi:hypothetical protein
VMVALTIASMDTTASKPNEGMALLNLYFEPTDNGLPVPLICTAFLKSELTDVAGSHTLKPEVVQVCANEMYAKVKVNKRVKIFFILVIF